MYRAVESSGVTGFRAISLMVLLLVVRLTARYRSRHVLTT